MARRRETSVVTVEGLQAGKLYMIDLMIPGRTPRSSPKLRLSRMTRRVNGGKTFELDDRYDLRLVYNSFYGNHRKILITPDPQEAIALWTQRVAESAMGVFTWLDTGKDNRQLGGHWKRRGFG